MAKYELPQYQSVYRDPGSVQINQLKRQEFLSNMQADNALATSIMNMDAMDEDAEQLAEIADLYTARIDERGERKDYENLGMSIHKDAMDFVKDYTPLQNELKKYNAYKQSLDDKVAANQISTQIRDEALRISRSKYTGIKKTPSGTIDRDSMFSGIAVHNYVDVDKRIQEKFKDVVERELAEKVDFPADGNYQIITKDSAPGTVPKHYIRIAGKDTFIPPAIVQEVVTGVFKEHDVSSFINQEAMFETYGKGEAVDGEVSESEAAVTSRISDLQKQISKAEAKDKLTTEEEQQLESNKNYLNEILKLRNEDMSSNNIHKILVAQDLQQEYASRANIKYAYLNQETSKEIRDRTGDGGAGVTIPPQIQYNIGAEGLSYVALGGGTTLEKNEYIANNKSILNKITSDPAFANAPEGTDILGQLYSINTEEEAQAFADLPWNELGNAETVHKMATEAKRARNEIELVNKQIELAFENEYEGGYEGFKIAAEKDLEYYRTDDHNNTYETKEASYNSYKEAAPGATVSIQEIKDIPSVANIIGDMSTFEFFSKLSEDKQFKSNIEQLFIDDVFTTPDGTPREVWKGKGEGNTDDYNVKARKAFNNLIGKFDAYMTDKVGTVDKGFTKDITHDGWVATSYGDYTTDSAVEMEEFLAGEYLDNMVMYAPNGDKITLGELRLRDGYKAADGVDGDGFEILSKGAGLLNVTRNGEPVIALPIKQHSNTDAPGWFTGDMDKAGDTHMFFVPVSQIKGIPSIQNYINSASFKVMDLYMQGTAAGIPSYAPPMFEDVNDIDEATGQPRRTVIFNYSDDNAASNAVEIWDKKLQRYEKYDRESGLKELATWISAIDADKYGF